MAHIRATLRAEVRRKLTWAKAVLLLALPYADDITHYVKDHLQELQPYVPDNVYKAMGFVVVTASLVISFFVTHRTLKGDR